jgi:hypothetical protein
MLSLCRKHKCGGFTDAVRCRPCTVRKVRCSFQDEIMEIRHNPYLCLTRPPPRNHDEALSPEAPDPDNALCLSPESAALLPSLATLSDAAAALQGPAPSVPEAVTDDPVRDNSTAVFGAKTPDHVRALTSRYAPHVYTLAMTEDYANFYTRTSIADLERRLSSAQHINSPRRQDQSRISQSQVETSLRRPTHHQSPSYPTHQHGVLSPAHIP